MPTARLTIDMTDYCAVCGAPLTIDQTILGPLDALCCSTACFGKLPRVQQASADIEAALGDGDAYDEEV